MRFFGLSHLLASSLVILSTIPALVNALPTNDLESRQSTIPLGPGTIHVVSDSNTTTYGCLDRNGRFILEGNKLSCGMFVPTGATDGAAWLKSSSGTCYFNKESSYNYQCKHVNQNVAADSLFALYNGFLTLGDYRYIFNVAAMPTANSPQAITVTQPNSNPLVVRLRWDENK